MTHNEFNIVLERLHKVETAYKGFTTRLRLLEAEVDKIKAEIKSYER